MTVMTVIHAPDPRLQVVSEAVGCVDDDVRRLADDLLETMYAEKGLGLSAIQVGIPRRIIVVDVARSDGALQPLKLVNPAVTGSSQERVEFDEGCLSFPELFALVERPASVDITYLDENGAGRELHADGLLARCLQHEIDHLDGILFVDHLSALRRRLILRKMIKWKKARLRDIA
ncbi:MAG: peptide deformylase [bacterium]|nr:peptide deformylase [bacterium]